jgi:hypothetical protein
LTSFLRLEATVLPIAFLVTNQIPPP